MVAVKMKTNSPGPWLTITMADGELIERIDLSDWDLNKPLARSALMEDICEAIRKIEKETI